MAINVNVNTQGRAPLSAEQLQAFSNQAFGTGAAPQVEIPGTEAVKQAMDVYNPQPIPVVPLPAGGIAGPVNIDRLSAQSTPEDLAQATQSSLAGRERLSQVEDEQGMPEFNPETGEYITQPVTMEDYSKQQEADLSTRPNMAPALMTEDPVEAGRAILRARAEVSQAESMPAGTSQFMNMDDELIKRWADSAAPALGMVSDATAADLFSPDSVIRSTAEGYYGVPAGLEILNTNNIPLEYARPISTVLGIAHARATEQSRLFKNGIKTDSFDDVAEVRDHNGNLMDAQPKTNLVNSTIASMHNALSNLGMEIPAEAVRQLAEAKVEAEIAQQRHVPMLDKNNNWVYGSSKELKDLAAELSYMSAALAGDERRSLPSKVPQIAGSNFIKPGSQGTKNSLPMEGAKQTVAETVKDMFGSIGEIFLPKTMLSTSMQLEDIKRNIVDGPEGFYSTSPFAKRHKVSLSDYNKLKQRVKPPSDYDINNPVSRAKFVELQNQHAKSVITNAIHYMEYDLENAQKIKGVVYTGYSHSMANQRFFRNNAGTDILASKNATREMLNFGIQGLTYANHFFDPVKIKNLQDKAMGIFSKSGKARNKALMALTPSERTALGLMECAVVNYYSFSGDPSVQNKDIKKQPEIQLIRMYNSDIGKHLGMLGKEYNDWLAGKVSEGSNIVSLLANMPRGEAQAYQNLWDDFSQLGMAAMDPAMANRHIKLSALNYDDGNQNGIFIQSLYASKPTVAIRLGSYNPNLSDMRGYALNIIGDNLSNLIPDNKARLDGWKTFFSEALNEKLASDLFKAPLMQNSYGKDSGMFFDHVLSFLEDSQEYNAIFAENVLPNYNSSTEAAQDLANALDTTLRKVIDPSFTRMLKKVGRMFAVINSIPILKGITGDDTVYSSVDLGFIPDQFRDVEGTGMTPEGQAYTTVDKGVQTNTYLAPEGIVEVQAARRMYNASAAKPNQSFWNKAKNKFDLFENALGSALSRLLGVMPIQSTDADLLKLMMLDLNADRKIPLPVATVHDSLITTMDTMHLYRNTYNNVAIPQAIPEIKKFAKQLENAYIKAKDEVFRRTAGASDVGIGTKGDFPALGAFFDDLNKKTNHSPEYETYIKNRSKDPIKSWEDLKAKNNQLLDKAKKAGWIDGIPNLTVSGSQFRDLFNMIESYQQLGGAENMFKIFANEFEGKVDQGFKALRTNNNVIKYGIAQMTHA